MFYSTSYDSSIGTIRLASDGDNLLGLWIEGQKYFGDSVPGNLTLNDQLPLFSKVKKWLDLYFSGAQPSIVDLSLAPIGSSFRQTVWGLLCEIPYGETTTYGNIAKAVALRTGSASFSSRAVGGAVGRNPISIIIPCHRVVGSDGSLTGYSGGISKKVHLLQHEGAQMSSFYIPVKGTAL